MLLEIAQAEDAPHAARVSAAVAILDRGFGKPAQTVQGPGGEVLTVVNRIELVARTADNGKG